jgi:HEAT repeat protein
MKKRQVIPFDSKARLLEKAREYVDAVDTFLAEADQATAVLLRAMKDADPELKQQIILVLGSFAKNALVWPLYELMTDPSEDEELRHHAAIQLSVIGPLIKDSQALCERLLQEMESPDVSRKLAATMAAGWRGNHQAATALVERLYDADTRVQQAAVGALCNLRDERILELLIDRLKHGAAPQRHAILLHLWRFESREARVQQVYRDCLEHEDPEVRFDALLCSAPVMEPREHAEVYRKCLRDSSARVRELALKRLAEAAGETVLKKLRGDIQALLNDPDVNVKRAALQILNRSYSR